jgi:hypothetical protein
MSRYVTYDDTSLRGDYYRTNATNILDVPLAKLLHNFCHIWCVPHKKQNSKSLLEQ